MLLYPPCYFRYTEVLLCTCDYFCCKEVLLYSPDYFRCKEALLCTCDYFRCKDMLLYPPCYFRYREVVLCTCDCFRHMHVLLHSPIYFRYQVRCSANKEKPHVGAHLCRHKRRHEVGRMASGWGAAFVWSLCTSLR